MKIFKGKIDHTCIATKTESENASTFFKCDRCYFRKNCAEHHVETTHRELQCQDCNFKVISINSMNTHIQSGHEFIQTIASAN